MKKAIFTLAAILAFGIMSAQTDTTRTRKIKPRTETGRNKVTPEQRKDTAATQMDRDRKRKDKKMADPTRTDPVNRTPAATSPTTLPTGTNPRP